MGGNQSKQILLPQVECEAELKGEYQNMELFFNKQSFKGMIPLSWIYYNIIGRDTPEWIRDVIYETIGIIEGKNYLTFEEFISLITYLKSDKLEYKFKFINTFYLDRSDSDNTYCIYQKLNRFNITYAQYHELCTKYEISMDESNITENLLRQIYYENSKSPFFIWVNYLLRKKDDIEGAVESDVLENISLISNNIDISSLIIKSLENIQKNSPSSNEVDYLRHRFLIAGGKSLPFVDIIINYLCDSKSQKILPSRWNSFFSLIIDKDYDIIIKFVVEQMSNDKNYIDNTNALDILSKNLTQKQINKLKDKLTKSQNITQAHELEDILRKLYGQSFNDKCKVYSYFIYIGCGIRPPNSKTERKILHLLINKEANFTEYFEKHLKKNGKYYLISSKFWNSWIEYLNSNNLDYKTFNPKIENEKLLDKNFQRKLKSGLKCPDHFMIIPCNLNEAISSWYKINIDIERSVKKYPKKLLNNSNIGRSFQFIDKGFIEQINIFKKAKDSHIYFLDLDLKTFIVSKVQDDGKKYKIKELISSSSFFGIFESKKLYGIYYELEFSKFICIEEIHQMIKTKFLITEPNKTRLWINNNIIPDNITSYFLREIINNIIEPIIYIEVLNPSGFWPTERSKLISQGTSKQVITNGLVNIGNSCYINAAIQCLMNSPFIKDFFQETMIYLKCINIFNPLGFQGKVALSFGELAKLMWSSEILSVNPSKFKKIIGSVNEIFRGSDQQDSQEFFNFLLDSLHEDTNMIIKKPAISISQNNLDLKEFSKECWAAHLSRNWSLFVFLFCSQLVSSLECAKCHSINHTFESFMSIPLHLADNEFSSIEIKIIRLNSYLRKLINYPYLKILKEGDIVINLNVTNEDKISDIIKRIINHDSYDLIKDENIVEYKMGSIYFFASTIKLYNPDKKIHDILETYSNSFCMIELLSPQSIYKHFVEKNTESKLIYSFIPNDKKNLLPLEVNSIHSKSMGNIKETDNSIIVNDTLQKNEANKNLNIVEGIFSNQQSKDKVDSIVNTKFSSNLTLPQNIVSKSENTNSLLFDKTNLSINSSLQATNNNESIPAKLNQQENANNLSNTKNNQNVINQSEKTNNSNSDPTKDKEKIKTTIPQDIDKSDKVENSRDKLMRINGTLFDQNYRQITFIQRKVIKRKFFSFINFSVDTCSAPILISFPYECKNILIYEILWMHLITKLHFDKRALTPWWRFNMGEKKSKIPFIIRISDNEGKGCNKCNELKRCIGCILDPFSETEYSFKYQDLLCVDWHSEVIEHFCDKSKEETRKLGEIIKNVTLDDCLQKFNEPETIQSMECNKCKYKGEHLKSYKFSKLPPLLVFHIKRYKNNLREKNYVEVKYPEEIDMDKFLHSGLHEPSSTNIYKLYGIINHYGILYAGHYKAIIYNHGQWLCYDDSLCTQIDKGKFNFKAAYMLFYMRKGIETNGMRDIFPYFEKCFAGKPTELKFGNANFFGYIKEQKEESQIVFKEFNKSFIAHVPKTDLSLKSEEGLYQELNSEKELNRINSNAKVESNCIIF